MGPVQAGLLLWTLHGQVWGSPGELLAQSLLQGLLEELLDLFAEQHILSGELHTLFGELRMLFGELHILFEEL